MKIGFIGVGNMGGAILKGFVNSKAGNEKSVYAFDADSKKLDALESELGINKTASIDDLVEKCDLIILAVKPNIFDKILPSVAAKMNKTKIVMSIAAGITMKFIEDALGNGTKVVRLMPNTPAMVNEGMTAIFKNQWITDSELAAVREITESIGKAELLNEDLIHTVIGVSGSSPAYAYMFIDALIDGAVKNGMDKDKAKIFAAQTVLGAAKMVLETGEEPTKLRIDVCSPGGTTIEAVEKLFENRFQEKVIEGMEAAIEKSKSMTK